MGSSCTKPCEKRVDAKGSFDSLDSKGSQNQFQTLVNTCREAIYSIEEPKTPRKSEFDRPRFASSVMVFFNNSKQDLHSNPYNFALERNPEVYFRYFPFLKIKENEGVFLLEREKVYPSDTPKGKESIENVKKSEEFQRHLKVTNKLVNSILGIAVSDDISTVAIFLKRIGAKHAELGIHAKYIYAFQESFLNWLEEILDPDKEVFRTWTVFIKYVIHMIIKGMNDHYTKVMFVYWSYQPLKTWLCYAPTIRAKPAGIDAEAMLSLRNMAANIEASQDD